MIANIPSPQLLNFSLISCSEKALVFVLSISAISSLVIPIWSPIGTKAIREMKVVFAQQRHSEH